MELFIFFNVSEIKSDCDVFIIIIFTHRARTMVADPDVLVGSRSVFFLKGQIRIRGLNKQI